MKLFVWNNPYGVSYGGSCLYVVAETEDQARALAVTASISKFGDAPEGALGEQKLGPPDRVVDVPYAEVYEWSE